MKNGILNDIYDGEADADKMIKDFARRLAPMGAHRWQIKEHKTKMFREALDIAHKESFDPVFMRNIVMRLHEITPAGGSKL